jgi:6-phosphofructokinase
MKTSVIGCPKTIDGDLKCKEVPASFGFDTACKVLFVSYVHIVVSGWNNLYDLLFSTLMVIIFLPDIF